MASSITDQEDPHRSILEASGPPNVLDAPVQAENRPRSLFLPSPGPENSPNDDENGPSPALASIGGEQHCNQQTDQVQQPTSTSNEAASTVRSPDRGDRTAISNIPLSPALKTFVRQSEAMYNAQMEKGYDSEGCEGPFFDCMAEEGPQEFVEDAVPEGRETEVQQEPNSETEADEHINIPEETLVKLKVSGLKEELKKRAQPHAGGKKALLKRLRDALAARIPVRKSEAKQKADKSLSGFPPTAFWDILMPSNAAVLEPVSKFNFYAPTIPPEDRDKAPPIKHDFMETFDRPVFEGRMKKFLMTRAGNPKRGEDGIPMIETVVREKGGVRDDFVKAHGLDRNTTPQEWFRAFLPDIPFCYAGGERSKVKRPPPIADWCSFTNLKATLCNAGQRGYAYPDWAPFTVEEIERHVGIYFLNGLSPSPQLEMKFSNQYEDPVNGSDLCNRIFGGSKGLRRHKMFKAFFCLNDPKKEVPKRSDDPNYKIGRLLRHMQLVGQEAWDPGPDLAIDEQTIGFQGRHADKRRITYKAEGDGFQCDALCDEGYTFSFYFRNQPAPKKYLLQGLSPLHSRVMSLFDSLRSRFHRVTFEKLYLSAKFCKASWNHPNKVLIAGVTRKGGRGLPPSVLQEEEQNKAKQVLVRGTVKAAVLKGDTSCPNLVATSVYDTKPVHFL